MQNANTITTQNTFKGILICLLSYFFVSLIGLCEKGISPAVSVPFILFIQNSICLLLITLSLIRNGDTSLKISHFGTYFIRIASGLGCYALLFYIIRFLPISVALLYQYTGALWIPLIVFAWLNEQTPQNLWWGILIGFAGIVLILKPSSTEFNLISLLGIACGVLQGFSVVAIRKLTLVEPISRILFYYFLAGTIALSPFAIQYWPEIGMNDLLLLIGVGVSTFLGQITFTLSSKYADPSTLAPISYMSIVFSGLFGWIIWQEIPEQIILLGMLLVIFGCILTLLLARSKAKDELLLELEENSP